MSSTGNPSFPDKGPSSINTKRPKLGLAFERLKVKWNAESHGNNNKSDSGLFLRQFSYFRTHLP